MANVAGVQPGEVVMPVKLAGINHCSLITEMRLKDGTDALELVRKKAKHPIVRWGLETHHILPVGASAQRGLTQPSQGFGKKNLIFLTYSQGANITLIDSLASNTIWKASLCCSSGNSWVTISSAETWPLRIISIASG